MGLFFYALILYNFPMTHSDHLAVFDWNSTLYDDMPAAHQATNDCLAFFGIAPISVEKLQEIFVFPLIHFYEKAGVNVDDYLKNTEEVSDIFRNSYNQLKMPCPLMDGTIELLDWLKSQQVTCKILSNLNQETLEEDVNRFGIADYFETISGNVDPATIISGTNKYERLRDFMGENGYSADKTFVIGDSHEEPQLARKLDIIGISISGGLLSPARLEKHKKDYIIDSLTELPTILSKEWDLNQPQTKLA